MWTWLCRIFFHTSFDACTKVKDFAHKCTHADRNKDYSRAMCWNRRCAKCTHVDLRIKWNEIIITIEIVWNETKWENDGCVRVIFVSFLLEGWCAIRCLSQCNTSLILTSLFGFNFWCYTHETVANKICGKNNNNRSKTKKKKTQRYRRLNDVRQQYLKQICR